MAKKPNVAILMGSISDWDNVLEHTLKTLTGFGIEADVHVMSAHRTPARVVKYVTNAEKNGIKVIIAAAGGAAHLAGVVAAHTTLPVIGIPVKGWSLDGMDSLMSTVQMPAGIPVASVAIGKAGAINAAIFAVQILASNNAALKRKLNEHREVQARNVQNADGKLRKQLAK